MGAGSRSDLGALMSAPVLEFATAQGPGEAGSATTEVAEPGADLLGRRARRWVVWIVGIVTVMLIFTYLVGLSGSSDVALDPNNPRADGMQGIAQVLGDEGVDVEVVRGVGSLPGTAADGATVMVSTTDYLSSSSGSALLDYSQNASSLVVLSPADNMSEVFDIDAAVTPRVTTTPMSPECESTLWAPREQVTDGDRLISVSTEPSGGQVMTCLPPSAGFNAGGSNSGYLVELQVPDRGPIVLAGLASSLTNEHILDEANAATGLRLLGDSDRLIWVIPSITDAGDLPPRGLFDVLPDAAGPAMALLVAALGMLALVQGRRLGPVSTEPLPVVIRAIETTTSRGRMYAQAEDRIRALASLQLASRRRLATRLGLAAGVQPDEVVAAVALAHGRHTDDIYRVLADPRVDDDATLVRIARDLKALEEGTPGT